MRILYAFLALFFVAFQAEASIEVVCKSESCLDHGWIVLDEWERVRAETTCRGDCRSRGWMVHYGAQTLQAVRCKNNDCFASGWRVHDVRNGFVQYDLTCTTNSREEPASCMSSGWVVRDNVNGGWTNAICIEGDCAYRGWEITSPRGRLLQIVTCKPKGCFEEGWLVSQE